MSHKRKKGLSERFLTSINAFKLKKPKNNPTTSTSKSNTNLNNPTTSCSIDIDLYRKSNPTPSCSKDISNPTPIREKNFQRRTSFSEVRKTSNFFFR